MKSDGANTPPGPPMAIVNDVATILVTMNSKTVQNVLVRIALSRIG